MSTRSGTPSTCTRQLRVSAWAWAGSSSGRAAPTSASRRQLPAVARARPVSGSTTSGSARRQPGRHGGDELRGHRVPVVEQRDLAVRGQHAAQPVAHPGDRVQQLRGRCLAGRPEQLRRVDQVGRGPGSGRRAPARSDRRPAAPAPPAGRSAGPGRERSCRSSPKNTARPASAFRFLIRWLPPTSDSRCRRRNPAWADKLARNASSTGLPATRSRCRPQKDQARRAAG